MAPSTRNQSESHSSPGRRMSSPLAMDTGLTAALMNARPSSSNLKRLAKNASSADGSAMTGAMNPSISPRIVAEGHFNKSAPLDQELAQHRAMATRFVLAIATYREVAAAGQRGERLDGVAVVRSRHLGAVLPGEGGPLGGRLGRLTELHGLEARREVGEPHVVPVPRCEFGLGHAARRTADRPDARALAPRPRAAEPDDANCHLALLGSGIPAPSFSPLYCHRRFQSKLRLGRMPLTGSGLGSSFVRGGLE